MRFTFVFKTPDGQITLTGECPEETSEGAFRAIEAEAQIRSRGPVSLVRTRFAVLAQDRAA